MFGMPQRICDFETKRGFASPRRARIIVMSMIDWWFETKIRSRSASGFPSSSMETPPATRAHAATSRFHRTAMRRMTRAASPRDPSARIRTPRISTPLQAIQAKKPMKKTARRSVFSGVRTSSKIPSGLAPDNSTG